MPSLVALYSIGITKYATDVFFEKKSVIHIAIENALLLPECKKVLILVDSKDQHVVNDVLKDFSSPNSIKVLALEKMTASLFFKACSNEKIDCKDVFIAPLEAPFIDINATKELYLMHTKYKAEYSFAEGYPEFIFPQILNIGLCDILSQFSKDENEIITHDFIFDIIKKDINSYDIETYVAPVDVRMLKLKFIVETKRDKMLCQNFIGIKAENYDQMIEALKLKTLPCYYMIEISSASKYTPIYRPSIEEKMFMSYEDFSLIVEKIAEFSDDAIISLSLYGEPLEHTDFEAMVKKVLSYPNLTVLVETNGLVENAKEKLNNIKDMVLNSSMRPNLRPPLYWITFIDAINPKTYAKVYNVSEEKAEELLKKANDVAEISHTYFGKNAFVQIMRMNENEDDLEDFYRSWKAKDVEVIIQKYDHYCNFLPDRRVADLSPLKRMPCRHINREMTINYNGDVLMCREDVKHKNVMGNAKQENLKDIWQRFDKKCIEQSNLEFGDLCESCDEYYTYNF
ncbi:MAG: spiro-SPASM protein [Treponema sp.]